MISKIFQLLFERNFPSPAMCTIYIKTELKERLRAQQPSCFYNEEQPSYLGFTIVFREQDDEIVIASTFEELFNRASPLPGTE